MRNPLKCVYWNFLCCEQHTFNRTRYGNRVFSFIFIQPTIDWGVWKHGTIVKQIEWSKNAAIDWPFFLFAIEHTQCFMLQNYDAWRCLSIWLLAAVHCDTFPLRHNAFKLRKDNAYTVFSFPATILSLSVFSKAEHESYTFSIFVLSKRARSLLLSISSKIPLRQTVQYIVSSILKFSDTQNTIHTAWFHWNRGAKRFYLMLLIPTKNFPHACV